jgi:hypothetical protein
VFAFVLSINAVAHFEVNLVMPLSPLRCPIIPHVS